MHRYLRTVTRAVREQQPDFVLWRGVPFWYFPLAPIVKKRTGVPYVLDLGDMWHMGAVAYRRDRRTGLRRPVDKLAEWWSVRSAALVCLTTDEQRDLYRERYDGMVDRIVTVRWGYDAPVLESVLDRAQPPEDEPFRVAIMGRFAFYGPEDAVVLAEGLAGQAEEGPVELVHVGRPEPQLRSAMEDQGLGDCLTETGMLPYEEGLAQVARANCAVLNPLSPVSVPVKTYDYIGLRKPIVAIAPMASALANLLRSYPAACLATSAEGAQEAFRWVRTELPRDALLDFAPSPYSLQHQFERLLHRLASLQQQEAEACE
jgi:glycosyltransferase involved in cell wall biosynthesis